MRINYRLVNARYWDEESAHYCSSHPEHDDDAMHPSWGLWHIPESQLKLLEGHVKQGHKLIDLGCGRGHDAVAFAKMGFDVLAVDISQEQLARAIPHPSVNYLLAAAERLPVEDESIDIVISDHGAFDHSPANVLLAEVHRVLKVRGLLVICAYTPLALACYDESTGRVGKQLVNSYPSNQMKYDGSIFGSELSYSAWVQVFRQIGFIIQRLEELMPRPESPEYFSQMLDSAWGSRWPCDLVWVVTKTQGE